MRFSFSMRCRWMQWAGAILISLLLTRGVGAHEEQEVASSVDIWPQRTFLTVRISGSGEDFGDIAQDKVPVGAHDHAESHGKEKPGDIAAAQRENADRYFAKHLMLKQGGVRLRGELQRMQRVKTDAFDASQTRFEAWYRYPRAPQLATQPLRVTSALLDFLGEAHTVVSLGGASKVLGADETAAFDASLAVASTARNARDWALAGAAQIVSNPRALLFLLAFLLLASLLSLRVLAAALGAFTLTHALAFALAVSGDAQMPTRIVEGGLAFLVALLGASAFLAARQAKPHRALAATLLVLAAACGFVQGFALAPLLRAHGLPAEGLTLSIAALVFGTLLAQVALLGVAWPILQRLRKRFEHNAHYGGTDWPRALQFISGAIVLLGGFWSVERFFS